MLRVPLRKNNLFCSIIKRLGAKKAVRRIPQLFDLLLSNQPIGIEETKLRWETGSFFISEKRKTIPRLCVHRRHHLIPPPALIASNNWFQAHCESTDGDWSSPVVMTNLQWFVSTYYRPAHWPLVLSICIFGISTQVLNIVILTRRPLSAMPSNILLAGLSVAQLILLTSYAIGTGYDIVDTPCNAGTKTYAWLTFLLINVNVNVVFHTIALLHTTLLAVFRYAAVAFPIKCKKLVSERGAKIAVVCAFAAVPVACASFYANSTIAEISANNSDECIFPSNPHQRVYRLKYTENQALRNYNFIFFGAVCKLFPCAAMIVLSSLLLLELKRVRDKRFRLIGEKRQKIKLENSNSATRSLNGNTGTPNVHNHRQHRHTTAMLVTVVLLLVSVEFPQGVINFLSVLLDNSKFVSHVYSPLGDFFEMLTVLYSSVNFIIYCLMSSQFRKAFKRILTNKCKRVDGPFAEDSTINGGSTRTIQSARYRGQCTPKREHHIRLLSSKRKFKGTDKRIAMLYDSISGTREVTNSLATDM